MTRLALELLARGPKGMVALSDSEEYSDSDSKPDLPPPPVNERGKAVMLPRAKRHRARRHRHRRRAESFMATARRANPRRSPMPPPPPPPPPPHLNRRLTSPNTHPARPLGAPDAEGFFLVCSRRCGHHRSPPRSPRPVPPDLVGLCFKCFCGGHIKANCSYPARCYNCWREGHRVAVCPLPRRPALAGGKRGRSLPSRSEGRGVPRRRLAGRLHRPSSADTISARSASTGHSFSMPRCCFSNSTAPADSPTTTLGRARRSARRRR